MKYKRLLAFGCSGTYGQGLEDCCINDGPGPNPSKFAWPQVLADKLGIECVNLSKPGNSNKNIWWNILNTDIHDDDLVIVCWTFIDRNTIICKDKTIEMQWWEDNEKSTKYFENIHNNHDAFIDFFIRYNHICSYLDSINIKNLHLNIFNYPSDSLNEDSLYKTLPSWIPEWRDKRIVKSIKYTQIRRDFTKKPLKGHLDKVGNIEYSNQVFNELQKQGII